MFIEDYVLTIKGDILEMGSSTKIIESFTFPLKELTTTDILHSNPNTYKKGIAILDKCKIVSFLSYYGHKGCVVEFSCYGEFDTYSFWQYENLELLNFKLKNIGSSCVQLMGSKDKVSFKIIELIDNLKNYETVLYKRR